MDIRDRFCYNFAHNLYYQDFNLFEDILHSEKCFYLTTRYSFEWMLLIENYVNDVLNDEHMYIETFKEWYNNRNEYDSTQIVILITHIMVYNETIKNVLKKKDNYLKIFNSLLQEYNNIEELPKRLITIIQKIKIKNITNCDNA